MRGQRSLKESPFGLYCLWVRLATASILVLLLISAPASAQESGTILGVIKDASGSVVPEAAVIIANEDTGQVRTTTTDTEGSYRVPALVVGRYSIRVEKTGFKTQ